MPVDGEFRILPYPMPGDGPFPVPGNDGIRILPIAVGEPHPGGRPAPPADGARPDPGSIPGSPPRIEIVIGSEGDDRLVLAAGGVARGAGGNDTFVLTSGGAAGGRFPERLGYITDFDEGDMLDLSQLGEKAAILSREGAPVPVGPERLLIDYDGDGEADGVLLVSGGRAPDMVDQQPIPLPQPRADLPYGAEFDPSDTAPASPPSVGSISFGLVEGWA